MAGVAQASASKTLRTALTRTVPVGTEVVADPVPGKGFGVGRCFCFADLAGTLQISQAPKRSTSGTAVTFRRTDTFTVTASGVSQFFDYNVRGDYVKVTWVPTAGDPTVFEFMHTLNP